MMHPFIFIVADFPKTGSVFEDRSENTYVFCHQTEFILRFSYKNFISVFHSIIHASYRLYRTTGTENNFEFKRSCV